MCGMQHFSLRTALTASLSLALAACMGAPSLPPQINFIGIGTGTLKTDINHIHFAQTFKPTDQALVAVVSFAHVEKGTTVQATWFSPDERQMPLGRTTITTQSGAKIARFSFASKQPWRPAPYEVRIDAMTGQGTAMKTASGSLSFFIGMKDADIHSYLDSYLVWQKAQNKQNAIIAAAQQKQDALTNGVATKLGTKHAMLALQSDFAGHGKTDMLIVGQNADNAEPPMGAGPGVLYAGTAPGFAVINGSGTDLLLVGGTAQSKGVIRSGTKTIFDQLPPKTDLQIVVLPSEAIVVTWKDAKKQTCSIELRADTNSMFTGAAPVCRK